MFLRRVLARRRAPVGWFSTATATTGHPHKMLNDRLQRCKTPRELERLIQKSPTLAFSGTNYVTAINMLGQLGDAKDEVVVRMVSEAEEVEIDPEELADLCVGLGWGELLEEIPEFVVEQIIADCGKISTSDLASILMSFAAIEHKHAQVCARLMEEILSRDVGQMPPSELALLLKSFAALDYFDQRLCDRFATEILTKRSLQDFKEDELAMVVHSLALFNYHHQPLLEALSQHVLDRDMLQFTVNDFALILSAMAKLGHFDSRVCLKFARFVLDADLQEFEMDELQLILHTFAEFKLEDYEVVQLFNEEFMSRDLKELTGEDFALILNSFYRLKYDDTFAASVIAKYVLERNSKEFYGTDMAHILQYLAFVGVYNKDVCAKFLTALGERTSGEDWEDFEPEDFSVLLDSLRKLEHKPDANVLRLMVAEVGKRSLESFTREQVAAMLDSLAHFGFHDQAAIQRLSSKTA